MSFFKIKASDLRSGMWLMFRNERAHQRIVDVTPTNEGRIKASIDYGNGGEPATSFFDKDEIVLASEIASMASEAGSNYFLRPRKTAAGFDLGTYDETGMPYSRESVEYFPSEEAATRAWLRGEWTQRDNP